MDFKSIPFSAPGFPHKNQPIAIPIPIKIISTKNQIMVSTAKFPPELRLDFLLLGRSVSLLDSMLLFLLLSCLNSSCRILSIPLFFSLSQSFHEVKLSFPYFIIAAH